VVDDWCVTGTPAELRLLFWGSSSMFEDHLRSLCSNEGSAIGFWRKLGTISGCDQYPAVLGAFSSDEKVAIVGLLHSQLGQLLESSTFAREHVVSTLIFEGIEAMVAVSWDDEFVAAIVRGGASGVFGLCARLAHVCSGVDCIDSILNLCANILLTVDPQHATEVAEDVQVVENTDVRRKDTACIYRCRMAGPLFHLTLHSDHTVATKATGIVDKMTQDVRGVHKYLTAEIQEELEDAMEMEAVQVLMRVNNGNSSVLSRLHQIARLTVSGPAPSTKDGNGDGVVHIMCAGCGKTSAAEPNMRACTRCLTTNYCSKACQKGHWKQHKKHCRDAVSGDRSKKKATDTVLVNFFQEHVDHFKQSLREAVIASRLQGVPCSVLGDVTFVVDLCRPVGRQHGVILTAELLLSGTGERTGNLVEAWCYPDYPELYQSNISALICGLESKRTMLEPGQLLVLARFEADNLGAFRATFHSKEDKPLFTDVDVDGVDESSTGALTDGA
jgi:hypothetical protein